MLQGLLPPALVLLRQLVLPLRQQRWFVRYVQRYYCFCSRSLLYIEINNISLLISSPVFYRGLYIANLYAGMPQQIVTSLLYINAEVRSSGLRPNFSFISVLIRIRRQFYIDFSVFSGRLITWFRVRLFQLIRFRRQKPGPSKKFLRLVITSGSSCQESKLLQQWS